MFEPGKCIKCGLCVRICEQAADEPLGLTFVDRGFDLHVGVPFDEGLERGLQKMAAECVEVCPTGALSRPDADSPVTINHELCIGCKACMMVCPFGVISLSAEEGKAIIKCDLCVDRLEEGREPACVEACPTGALRFTTLDEYLAERRTRAAHEAQEAADASQGDALVTMAGSEAE